MELRNIETNNTITTWTIDGNLDCDSAKNVQPHIDAILEQNISTDIEVDFRQVQFLDSSGVGALVYLYKRLVERERTMRIENVTGQPLEIMTLLRINQAIPVNSQTH